MNADTDVADVHVEGKQNKVVTLTTDLALIEDPVDREISDAAPRTRTRSTMPQPAPGPR